MTKALGKLYLLPTTLGESGWESVIPQTIPGEISSCRHFIVENVRSARRYLRLLDSTFDIDNSEFYLIDKHTKRIEQEGYLKTALEGNNIAVISESGCPGIADPGSEIVRMAHQKGIRVIPFVGPSSILLALMASGMNGQSFSFHGYLPVPKADRILALKELERLSQRDGSSHIFIETPYRNNGLIEDAFQQLLPETLFCIAKNITLTDEWIQTKAIRDWRKQVPDIHKQTCIFLIQASAVNRVVVKRV
jgi:16S rRNA (cytidine1402-2'-O)-methyltransferase